MYLKRSASRTFPNGQPATWGRASAGRLFTVHSRNTLFFDRLHWQRTFFFQTGYYNWQAVSSPGVGLCHPLKVNYHACLQCGVKGEGWIDRLQFLYFGPSMSSGCTHSSNCSAVKILSSIAVSLSVFPFLWAVFAILAAASYLRKANSAKEKCSMMKKT